MTPAEIETQFRRAEDALRLGDLKRGFELYRCRVERRLLDPASIFHSFVGAVRWDGSPTDQRVVVVWEQGAGDFFQFCRFLRPAAARAPGLIYLAHKSLGDIGSRHFPELVRATGALTFALWAPLLDLPHALGIESIDQLDSAPYLTADPAAIARWAPRLAETRFKVGLVWRGSPQHARDTLRSMPAELYRPLSALPIALFSLQVPATDTPAFAVDLGRDTESYEDTAAIIAQLDLVITVDTSVAHLAGALGKPVWILVPHGEACDWRWLRERTDSPWYASARLFRQPHPGNWTAVIEAVYGALYEHVSAARPGGR
jgi:hypothetical protein